MEGKEMKRKGKKRREEKGKRIGKKEKGREGKRKK